MSMLKFVFSPKGFVRALSCEDPLWAPKGDAVFTVGSRRVPPRGDILSFGMLPHRADFIDQSQKFCCAENVTVYAHAGIFIFQDGIDWSNWLTGDQNSACCPDMPLPGSSLTPGPAWHRPLAVQPQLQLHNSEEYCHCDRKLRLSC